MDSQQQGPAQGKHSRQAQQRFGGLAFYQVHWSPLITKLCCRTKIFSLAA
jgi:hypothetical protein